MNMVTKLDNQLQKILTEKLSCLHYYYMIMSPRPQRKTSKFFLKCAVKTRPVLQYRRRVFDSRRAGLSRSSTRKKVFHFSYSDSFRFHPPTPFPMRVFHAANNTCRRRPEPERPESDTYRRIRMKEQGNRRDTDQSLCQGQKR